ncbi:MAG: DUF2089 domain-containing protein [Erysipelotrichaceae bacterium]
MKKKLLGNCPICGQKMVVSQLSCKFCNSTISGSFSLSKFDYLSEEEQQFALIFIKNAGNIKQIEKELNISYPTVKKMLDSVIKNLGFTNESNTQLNKETVLDMLRKNEISFQEADDLLKQIGG